MRLVRDFPDLNMLVHVANMKLKMAIVNSTVGHYACNYADVFDPTIQRLRHHFQKINYEIWGKHMPKGSQIFSSVIEQSRKSVLLDFEKSTGFQHSGIRGEERSEAVISFFREPVAAYFWNHYRRSC